MRLDRGGRREAQILAMRAGDDLDAGRQTVAQPGGHEHRGQAEEIDGGARRVAAQDVPQVLGAPQILVHFEQRIRALGQEDDGMCRQHRSHRARISTRASTASRKPSRVRKGGMPFTQLSKYQSICSLPRRRAIGTTRCSSSVIRKRSAISPELTMSGTSTGSTTYPAASSAAGVAQRLDHRGRDRHAGNLGDQADGAAGTTSAADRAARVGAAA